MTATAKACFWMGWLVLASVALPAQIVATATAGVPSQGVNPHFGTFSAGAKIGIALPSAPHLLLLWNAASLDFDRIQQSNGGSFESGLEAWVSPTAHPAQSHAPLLMTEAALGRRWGSGLHGYTALGPAPVIIVIGLHWVLFG